MQLGKLNQEINKLLDYPSLIPPFGLGFEHADKDLLKKRIKGKRAIQLKAIIFSCLKFFWFK